MDKPKVVVKKKKIKKKPKSKAKTPTQMQTQRVVVNLTDALKSKSKSKSRRKPTSKASTQVIYQPAPTPLQPDIQNIIRSEISKAVGSQHQQLTPSKIEQDVNNLVTTPEPVLVRTESPMMRSIGANLEPVGERPIILEPVDEEPVIVTEPEPAKERVILLMKPGDLQPVGVPMLEPEIKMETFEEKAKRGRPVGYKPSDETKSKIAESLVKTKALMKEQALQKEAEEPEFTKVSKSKKQTAKEKKRLQSLVN